MKGAYHVIVQNRYLKFEFDIRRNLTIIQGDSATGKTTLVEMIREHNLDKKSGINLSCSRPCRVLEGDLWREQLMFINDSILFIDEGAAFVETEEFAIAVKGSTNYFVIVTRENLEMLPISVEEVYGIKSSGRFGKLEPVYHEMYHIYNDNEMLVCNIKPEVLLIEDSNSGFEFFNEIAKRNKICCISAEGKSNIFSKLIEKNFNKNILVIADGAAFASQMNRINKFVKKNSKIFLYLPESFEWFLLSLKIPELMKDGEINKILDNPNEYIDSKEYFSWERYFTRLLMDKTKDSYLKYNKNRLNENYLQKSILEKAVLFMRGIDLI